MKPKCFFCYSDNITLNPLTAVGYCYSCKRKLYSGDIAFNEKALNRCKERRKLLMEDDSIGN